MPAEATRRAEERVIKIQASGLGNSKDGYVRGAIALLQSVVREGCVNVTRRMGPSDLLAAGSSKLVRRLAHTVSVMRRGRIVGHRTVTDIFDNAAALYAQAIPP